MEDWLTTYEAVRISGYELDYVRKLVHTQKIVVANGDSPGRLAAHHIPTVVPEIPGTEGLKRGRNPNSCDNKQPFTR